MRSVRDLCPVKEMSEGILLIFLVLGLVEKSSRNIGIFKTYGFLGMWFWRSHSVAKHQVFTVHQLWYRLEGSTSNNNNNNNNNNKHNNNIFLQLVSSVSSIANLSHEQISQWMNMVYTNDAPKIKWLLSTGDMDPMTSPLKGIPVETIQHRGINGISSISAVSFGQARILFG